MTRVGIDIESRIVAARNIEPKRVSLREENAGRPHGKLDPDRVRRFRVIAVRATKDPCRQMIGASIGMDVPQGRRKIRVWRCRPDIQRRTDRARDLQVGVQWLKGFRQPRRVACHTSRSQPPGHRRPLLAIIRPGPRRFLLIQ